MLVENGVLAWQLRYEIVAVAVVPPSISMAPSMPLPNGIVAGKEQPEHVLPLFPLFPLLPSDIRSGRHVQWPRNPTAASAPVK